MCCMATVRRLCLAKHNFNTLLSSHYLSSINTRNAVISATDDIEKLYNSITLTLDNMQQFSKFECRMAQLNKLSNELKNERLTEDESMQLHQQHNNLQQQLWNWQEFEQNSKEYWQLYELAVEDNDESLKKDCYKQLQSISTNIEELYYSLLLNQDADDNGCYVQVSSGSGGMEAQDWALTLFEMYIAWCRRHKYDYKILCKKKADIGINQATLQISSFNAYGWLRYEEGVHRRSRISPYGQTGGQKRQTSFASVQVTPMTLTNDNDLDVGDINDKDLEWDVFRGSGPGGQHRNTTDSAVRCIHKPSGTMVTVQDERNQYNAKIAALRYLKFKLKRLQEENVKKLKKDKYSTFCESTFSNQIRNYVYTPYQMIKDNRTKCELKNNAVTDALKNGNIDLLLKKSIETFNRVDNSEADFY